MKKHYFMAILIMMIGISSAVQSDLQSLTGYNFADLSLNQPDSSPATVKIKDGSFQPSTLTVAAGTRVEWNNQDGVQHTVTSDIQGLFDSGTINPGKKYALSFNTPGSYGYHCAIHQTMRGTITVTAAASGIESAALAQGAGAQRGASSPSWSELPMSSSDQGATDGLQQLIGSSSARGPQLQERNPAITTSLVQPAAEASSDSSSQVALERFSSYYRMDSTQSATSPLTSPAEIDSDDAMPQTLYFGSSQKAVPYSQYQSYALSSGTNSLWISGTSSWTQYAVAPLGSRLDLIASSPSGGYGYLYEIYPDASLDKNTYTFYPYNRIGFYADRLGEHQLFFNIAGQPSNIIVINVVPYQPQVEPTYDYAAVTVRSTWLRGYNLYVDGSYRATEGMTGEPDGTVTINVPGGQYHNIAIDGGITFSENKYFQSGYAYQLNL